MITIKRKNLYLLIFVLFLLIISFFIIRSFIIPILFTAILVYLFRPVYKKLLKIFRSDFITSMISILIILSILIIPATVTVVRLSNEIETLRDVKIENSLDQISSEINNRYNIYIDLNANYNNLVSNFKIYISEFIYNKLPSFIFQMFIILFFFYYFLKNYEKEGDYLTVLLKKFNLIQFSEKIKKLVEGIIYGQILVRFIQASFGAVLFFFIGVKGALLWGILMFFAAFIPLVGTSLIWMPLGIINMLEGNINVSILIFLTGIIVSVIDNFLFPLIISDRINIGPVVTLISILGGIQVFGIYGIILGPFFLGLLFVFLEELIIKFREDNPQIKRYVWTEEERKKYKRLKTQEAKDEFIRMIDNKYIEEEKKGSKEIKFRYYTKEEIDE